MSFFQFAPATEVTFTELDEVNGAFELRTPNRGIDLPLIPVDMHKGSWTDERVHRVIGEGSVFQDEGYWKEQHVTGFQILTRPAKNTSDRSS